MWHTEDMNNAGASSACSKHRKYHPGAPFNVLPPFLFLSFQSNVHHKTSGKSSTFCSLGSEGTGHPQNKVCSVGTGWHWELCSASLKRILAPKKEEKATWTRLNHTSVCSAVLTVISYCTLFTSSQYIIQCFRNCWNNLFVPHLWALSWLCWLCYEIWTCLCIHWVYEVPDPS